MWRNFLRLLLFIIFHLFWFLRYLIKLFKQSWSPNFLMLIQLPNVDLNVSFFDLVIYLWASWIVIYINVSTQTILCFKSSTHRLFSLHGLKLLRFVLKIRDYLIGILIEVLQLYIFTASVQKLWLMVATWVIGIYFNVGIKAYIRWMVINIIPPTLRFWVLDIRSWHTISLLFLLRASGLPRLAPSLTIRTFAPLISGFLNIFSNYFGFS